MASIRSKTTVSAEDHHRITQTIRGVETKTSGEVYAVVAHQSDDYFYVSAFFAALWALVLGALLALAAWWSGTELPSMVLALAQLASFASSVLALYLAPQLRLLFVPRSLAYRRASNNAVRQFLAHGIHTTDDRSGVLIFVSLAERYAEIVADSGINQKVDQSEWDAMVGGLTSHAAKGEIGDGFVLVIQQAGELLAKHFPPIDGQMSELDDRLVEI